MKVYGVMRYEVLNNWQNEGRGPISYDLLEECSNIYKAKEKVRKLAYEAAKYLTIQQTVFVIEGNEAFGGILEIVITNDRETKSYCVLPL